ncbi:MAG: sugar transferase [Lachnospiraceae bacterium]|jgi:exopolysaccharide biosynthesis polyprenyl glycosylphosphotransferase|nr:sugar transferase [Lachnospiraceae bacterium]
MRRHYFRFEKSFWVGMKLMLYTLLLGVFMLVMSRISNGLVNLSRTMGIVITTFIVLEIMFVKTYGGYDVGRRKSKPIIFSLSFATAFTDVIVYVQLMIMKTNGMSASDFRFWEPQLVLVVMAFQLVVISIFTYMGNGIFFWLHDPEKCMIITSNQDGVNEVVRCVTNLKKQYRIEGAVHYKNPDIVNIVKSSDTLFLYDIPAEYRSKIMKLAYKHQKNVYLAPELDDIMEVSSSLYLIDDTVMINYLSPAFTFEQRIAKRLLDIFLSLIIGIITAPIVAIAALCIKLEDGGPVFYKQSRATIHGRIFEVLKLRSMKANDNRSSATKDDDRITRIGKIIRRTRIDEIPQIYNVLKGEMSFVGPRPEMIKNVEMYTQELPEFEYRLRVKAGLTGYAQIQGKYNTTPRDKLIMDMMYIEQFSILLDIQLIFQTIIAVIRPDSSEGFKVGDGGNCLNLVLDPRGSDKEE